MNRGRVYLWTPDPSHPLGGRVGRAIVELPRLDPSSTGSTGLRGRYVRVRNAGEVNFPDDVGGSRAVRIGNVCANDDSDYLYEPGHGGGRLDKVVLPDPDVRERYVQAAHFGEVNTYYHLDLIADYVDGLMRELGTPPLPTVIAVVNAHHAATQTNGLRRGTRWQPFQGGHYRLPSRRYDVCENEPIEPDGEIHLGPGRRLTEFGALVEAAGGRYRANASHNAGILYHEYGHHVTRHTADYRGNTLRRPDRQNNVKTAMDEGTCDYLTAAILGTPHIWAWHRRHDEIETHPRSLVSRRTMNDFDSGPKADPHVNGTIWASALWDLRSRLIEIEGESGGRQADLLVMQALILIGGRGAEGPNADVRSLRAARESFATGLTVLLEADAALTSGRRRTLISSIFAARGILPEAESLQVGNAQREIRSRD